jgi:hypothetical protein
MIGAVSGAPQAGARAGKFDSRIPFGYRCR